MKKYYYLEEGIPSKATKLISLPVHIFTGKLFLMSTFETFLKRKLSLKFVFWHIIYLGSPWTGRRFALQSVSCGAWRAEGSREGRGSAQGTSAVVSNGDGAFKHRCPPGTCSGVRFSNPAISCACHLVCWTVRETTYPLSEAGYCAGF